jgi:hypothetical protein
MIKRIEVKVETNTEKKVKMLTLMNYELILFFNLIKLSKIMNRYTKNVRKRRNQLFLM